MVHAGRNFKGRICVQHQGAGDKHNYIKIDRFRFVNLSGFVLRIIDTFFSSSFLGLIIYVNGLLNFINLSEGLKLFSFIFSGYNKIENIGVGSTQRLFNITLFDSINSLEIYPFSGAKLARSAGAFAKIISKERYTVVVKLNSGWLYKISAYALASLGVSSNLAFIYSIRRKAGFHRNWGIRPTVRGVIKNPCDHPHGGGEGKGSPPVAQVSPWGWLCKGTPTKQKKVDRLNRKLFKKV